MKLNPLRWPLATRIIAGLAVGAAAGLVTEMVAGPSPDVRWLVQNVTQPIGSVFLRIIFMVVIPLIFAAIVLGVAEMGDIRKLGERAGGTWVGGTHFVADGNQVMSMTSWLVFMRKNEPRSRYFDVRLPRPNLKVDFAEQARSFAHELADGASSSPAAEPERERDATR